MADLTPSDVAPARDAGDAARRLAARVQAWQHRNPLARRLPLADVGGLGVIALPYGPADAKGKRQPLFHQPRLVPGLSHRVLVEFAQRHAVAYRPGPEDWPLREIERDDAAAEPAPATRYLLTAAITEPVKPGAQPRRLLIAPEGRAIWGPRPLSRQRTIVAGVLLLVLLTAAVWALRSRGRASVPVAGAAAPALMPASSASAPREPTPATAPAHRAAASTSPSALPNAASAGSAASAKALAPPVPAGAGVAAHGSAAVPAASASPPAPNSPPTSPPSSAAAGAAVKAAAPPAAPAPIPAASRASPSAASSASPGGTAKTSAAAPASSPATSASTAPTGGHGTSAAATPPPAAASPALPPPKLLPMPARRGGPAPGAETPTSAEPEVALPAGPHFALVSMPTKKRAEAEETLARVKQLLGPAIGSMQAQVMPSPEGFVVTMWPVPTQADAEQLAQVLARRGVPMKWLEF